MAQRFVAATTARPPIRTAQDAADLLAPCFADASGERVVVLILDDARYVLGHEERAGDRAMVDMPMRDVMREAMRFSAAGIIVAHNHPGGDPSPSAGDLAATRRLAETAASVGLALHDHLIFAGGQCRSMRGLGLL